MGVGKMGLAAPFHAGERRSANYPARFSKQFRKGNSRMFAYTEFAARSLNESVRPHAFLLINHSSGGCAYVPASSILKGL
jgi:hypothetical protein